MKKKIKMIISIIMVLFIIQYFIYKKNTNDIEKINFNDIQSIKIESTCGYLSPTYIYIINFFDNSIMHKIEDSNESEKFYTEFNNKDLEFFMNKANLYGFFHWNESYNNPYVDDGKSINIHINFKDGSIKETYCYADFPLTYDLMADVFYEAFGLII